MFRPLGCQAPEQEHDKSAALSASAAFNNVSEGCSVCLRPSVSLSEKKPGVSTSAQKEKEPGDLQGEGLFITM